MGYKNLTKSEKAHAKPAFTLAETLITLVIVGIVAALTIPNLIVKYQKEQTVTKLKKAYSTLSQTTNRAIADNGPINTWEVLTGREDLFAEKYLLPYLSIGKNCKNSSLSPDCKFIGKGRSSINSTFSLYSRYKFILQDGTMIALATSGKAGDSQIWSYVFVDINGAKGPNISGRDIFVFIYFLQWGNSPLYNGKFFGLYPHLTRKALLDNCKYENSTNFVANPYCAMLIMKDGWKISDDYPW